MSLLIGLLDDGDNTDVIILINYLSKTMTWIPRDLYSPRILHRINSAYSMGVIHCLNNAWKIWDFNQ